MFSRLPRAVMLGASLVVLASPPVRAQDAASTPAFPPDPNATRLFFGPTGRSLPAGGGYAGVYGFFLPFVQVGVSDRVSIGGGTPLVYPMLSAFWFTPKVQVLRGPRVQASTGVVHVVVPEDGRSHVGVGYGVATFGSENSAVTAGAGWAYARGDGTRGDGVLVMIGAERRISRRTKLMTENYLSAGTPVLMGGVRLIGERFSADFALTAIADRHDPVVFPMLNLTCSFGKP